MTYSSNDLSTIGVDPRAVAFRRWRRDHKLSLADCAQLIGTHVSAIQRVEIGTHRMTPRMVGWMQTLMRTWTESKRPKKVDGRKNNCQRGALWTRALEAAAAEVSR